MNSVIRKLDDRFVETTIDSEVVIMRLSDGDFFSLTDTALATWNLIDGQRTIDEISRELRERYDGEGIGRDVAGLVDELVAADILTLDPVAP